MEENTKDNTKELFKQIVEERIKRPGVDKLMSWLEHDTDFFVAPASARYHGAFQGGLCTHSLNVYLEFYRLLDVYKQKVTCSQETAAICGLFHDLCKVNTYNVSTRNVKNDITGAWEKKPYYAFEDSFPYGHGEKSVYLLSKYIQLTDEEAMAIRWHMAGFDNSVRGGSGSMSDAYRMFPLAVLLNSADMVAAYIDEAE